MDSFKKDQAVPGHIVDQIDRSVAMAVARSNGSNGAEVEITFLAEVDERGLQGSSDQLHASALPERTPVFELSDASIRTNIWILIALAALKRGAAVKIATRLRSFGSSQIVAKVQAVQWHLPEREKKYLHKARRIIAITERTKDRLGSLLRLGEAEANLQEAERSRSEAMQYLAETSSMSEEERTAETAKHDRLVSEARRRLNAEQISLSRHLPLQKANRWLHTVDGHKILAIERLSRALSLAIRIDKSRYFRTVLKYGRLLHRSLSTIPADQYMSPAHTGSASGIRERIIIVHDNSFWMVEMVQRPQLSKTGITKLVRPTLLRADPFSGELRREHLTDRAGNPLPYEIFEDETIQTGHGPPIVQSVSKFPADFTAEAMRIVNDEINRRRAQTDQ